MLFEALEILQSTGNDENTFITDFALYKVIYILTVYMPLIMATFLLSQEYLGDKIACFSPENFTETQALALNEHCWTNGFWVSEGTKMEKNLYTQPHRYYPFYLPIQAVICMVPIVMWNILTKSKLLAILKGTEEFLEDLLDVLNRGTSMAEDEEELPEKVKDRLKQLHEICITAAEDSALSYILIVRLLCESILFSMFLWSQYIIYDHHVKYYHCTVPHLSGDQIVCAVPILDLLDIIWSINTAALFIAIILIAIFMLITANHHFGKYQPMFYNSLPYGDEDNFNECVKWNSPFTKHSYQLLTAIFEENSTIMTKAYVLCAIKPHVTRNFEAIVSAKVVAKKIREAKQNKQTQDQDGLNETLASENEKVHSVASCEKTLQLQRSGINYVPVSDSGLRQRNQAK